jgi:hypothetical protein
MQSGGVRSLQAVCFHYHNVIGLEIDCGVGQRLAQVGRSDADRAHKAPIPWELQPASPKDLGEAGASGAPIGPISRAPSTVARSCCRIPANTSREAIVQAQETTRSPSNLGFLHIDRHFSILTITRVSSYNRHQRPRIAMQPVSFQRNTYHVIFSSSPDIPRYKGSLPSCTTQTSN